MNERDQQRRLEVWIHRRRGPLAGAVAAHLAELSDADLQQVPFCCDVMVDLRAVLYDLIDVTSVSLAWRASSSTDIYLRPKIPEHHFCSSFIYALNGLDPYPAMNLAHESPYCSEWIALSRSEQFALLVAHFVSQDAVDSLLHELIQEELLDPDGMF